MATAQPREWDAAKGVWVGEKAAGDEIEIPSPLWIFGYGSLCWKTEFPFEERFVATLDGYTRLFWQRSCDHRGTPEQPGRVVTLVQPRTDDERDAAAAVSAASCVHGIVYRVADSAAQSVLAALDFREKGGYTRAVVTVREHDTGDRAHMAATTANGASAPGAGASTTRRTVEALLYTGTVDNPNFDAEGSLDALASTIARSTGPSGPNKEYLFHLCDFLRSVGAQDEHAFGLEARVRAMLPDAGAAAESAGEEGASTA